MTTRPLVLAALATVLLVSSVASADEASSVAPPVSTATPVVTAPAPASPVPVAPEAPEVEEGTGPVAVPAPSAPPARVAPVSSDGASDAPVEGSEATEVRTMPGARYGLEILLADGVALGMAAVSLKVEQPGLGILGLTTYAMAPPIVHFIHGRPGRAAASFGLRVGSPAVGMMTGIALGCAVGWCSSRGDFGWVGAFIGGAVGVGTGAIAAMVVDAVVLAREPDVKVRVPRGWDGKPRIAPTVSALPGGGAVGVGGSF